MRETLLAVAAASLLFVVVLLSGNAFRDLLGYLAGGQISPGLFLEFAVLLLPYVTVYALPLGFLTGILLALGRLSSTREILAMKAAGMSLGSIAGPILALALAGTAASGWFINQVGPENRHLYRQKLATVVQEEPLGFFTPGTFVQRFPGYVLFFERKDANSLYGLRLWELDEDDRAVFFFRAEKATVFFDTGKGHLVLRSERALAERREPGPNYTAGPADTGFGSFREVEVSLSLEELMGSKPSAPSASRMTLGQLREAIAGADSPGDALRYRVQMQKNLAMSFATLALTVLALPLGIRVGRRETSANLAIALGLALFYYFLIIVVSWFEELPALHPEWLVWLPNLLFLVLGAILIRRAART